MDSSQQSMRALESKHIFVVYLQVIDSTVSLILARTRLRVTFISGNFIGVIACHESFIRSLCCGNKIISPPPPEFQPGSVSGKIAVCSRASLLPGYGYFCKKQNHQVRAFASPLVSLGGPGRATVRAGVHKYNEAGSD